jgi:glycogen debranching enzyme
MNNDEISILDGSTFLVSRANGDIDAKPDQPHGLFFGDTRHLSKWNLTVQGESLEVLSTDNIEYYLAQHFCTIRTGTIYKDHTVSVVRRRFIGDGLVENLALFNHGANAEDITLALEADADFADLFEVKDVLKKQGEYSREFVGGELVIRYCRGDFRRETHISSSVLPTQLKDNQIIFSFILKPKTMWVTQLHVKPKVGEQLIQPKFADAKSTGSQALRNDLNDWVLSAPSVTANPPFILDLYLRSLVDIAALRFCPDVCPECAVPAAGLPWFMALFGRDSLITSYQLLPYVPKLAKDTLRTLAAAQGKVVDDFREEEPGRILHELRVGELTHFKERPQSPYFGTSDATPLFLILLDEYERWTGDTALVAELEPNARAALDWIAEYGDRDGDGYVEYERKTELGLSNQCWKDSYDSILFADGTLASTPIATCEIQGYAYDAKVRCARLARLVWKDEALAQKLEREAAELKKRFNKDYWIENGQFFALALDGNKRQVDSLTSNIGHLLWSGIVDDDKAVALAKHLVSPPLFSGWGVRTMATSNAGYNPLGYHDGTVWPHDNSIIAAGLFRYGFRDEATQIASAIIESSLVFDHRLPEAFAGYSRERTMFPVRYPTASSPQAWAAGAAMLCISVILGLEVKGNTLSHSPRLPAWITALTLEEIRGRWGSATVVAQNETQRTGKQVVMDIIGERETLTEGLDVAA